MGNDLKTLADKIKAQQSGKDFPIEEKETNTVFKEEIPKETPKEVITKNPKANENLTKQDKKVEALISKIKLLNKDSKSGGNMIHTRIEDKVLMKLKILNAYGLSTQSIVSYLVSDFLEKEEVKILIKQILENDLE